MPVSSRKAFALVQDAQCLFGERLFLAGCGGAADVEFGEPLEHPDALHVGTGVEEPADQRGNGLRGELLALLNRSAAVLIAAPPY